MRRKTLVALVLVLCMPALRAAATTPPTAKPKAPVVDRQLQQEIRDARAGTTVIAIAEFTSQLSHAQALTALRGAGLHTGTDFPSVNATVVYGSASAFTASTRIDGLRRLEFPERLKLDNTTAAWATRVRALSDETGGLDLRVKDANGRYIDGTGVGIGIVDSGTDGLHPDLSWCGAPNADQNTCKTKVNFKITCPTQGIVNDANGNCPVQVMENVPNSDTTAGHGTHVSGIAAGDGTASHGLYRGTAPGAKLYGFGSGDGDSIFTLNAATAFQWILDNGAKQNPPIKVINNSYGDPGFYDANNPDILSLLGDKLIDAGVTVVWAAGNSGQSPCAPTGDPTASVPCTGPDANNPKPGNLSVANYDDAGTGSRDNGLESDSSQGYPGRPDTNPDFAAPGSNIISACNAPSVACDNPAFGLPAPGYEPYYTHLSGTSMAAPHTTGVVADLYQADPNITPAQIEKILKDTAHRFTAGAAYDETDPTDPDSPTSIDKGHGLIDTRAAVLSAMQLAADTGLSGGSPTTVVATADGGDESTDSLDLTSVDVHEVHGTEASNVPGAPSGDRIELIWNLTGMTSKPTSAPNRYQLTGSVDGVKRTFSVDWDGTKAVCTNDLADSCVAAVTPTSVIASYDASAFGAHLGAPFFDLVATTWGDIQNAPKIVQEHCNASNDVVIGTLNTDMPTLCAADRAPGFDSVPPAELATTLTPLRGTPHVFTFTPAGGTSTCGQNSPEIVDPEGDATAFLVDTGAVPSDPSLDIREGRITWDAATRNLTFHIKVSQLSSTPPTGATGKLFRFLFDYAGTTYEVQAESDDTAGTTSFTIDAADAAGTFGSVADITGAFDVTNNEIRVVMPVATFNSAIATFDAGQTPAVTPPPPMDWGSALSNLEIDAQREIGTGPVPERITPTADTATGTCNYSIGADLGVHPPKAVDDAATTRQPQPVTVDVLANDNDPDGSTLHVVDVSQGAHGGAVRNPDDSVTYTPSKGFFGTDHFTYTIANTAGITSQATVTIDVTSFCPATPTGTFTDTLEPNPDPNWQFDTSADFVPVNTWASVTDSNAHSPTHSFNTDDTAPEKDDRLVSPPVDLTSSSHLVFFHRIDTEDPDTTTPGDPRFFDAGVLEISTDGGKTWQDVTAGGGTFVEGGYNGRVLNDPSYVLGDRPAWGGDSGSSMTKVDVDLGAYAGTSRLVRWRFANDDSNAPSATNPAPDGWWVDDISFTGLPVVSDCGPQAVDDTAATDLNKSVNVDVLANDFDPDGEAVTIDHFDASSAHGGTIQPAGDGSLTYTPPSRFAGADTFAYTITDPSDKTASATVTVNVASAPPVAVDDHARVKAGKTVKIAVLANDSDPQGEAIRVASADARGVHGGAVVVNPDGTISYTAPRKGAKSDSFVYTITDTHGGRDSATVTITIVKKK